MSQRKGWYLGFLLILALWMTAAGAQAGTHVKSSAPPPVVEVRDAPSLGPENAAVTIVEFADFQCPYCARVSRMPKTLLKIYPTQVRWVFKHYPLRIHPDAPLAHEAAQAAQEQGKFWEMHRLLFRNQNRVKREDLVSYASRLNLDMAAFKDAIDSRRLRARVVHDIKQGRSLHVSGTPTYFINGKKIFGTRSISEFRQLIERELESGTPSPRPLVEQTSAPDR